MIETLSFDAATCQQTYELDVFGKRGPVLVSGKGVHVWDDQGRRYLDCIAGQGSLNLGHCHPEVTQAICHQARSLVSCPGAFYNDVRARYMQELVGATPAGLTQVFLCNSGTEAVEAALKFARISTGRSRIIAAKRAFHGRTHGAMSVTFNRKYVEGCGALVPEIDFVSFNDLAALEKLMDGRVAAVLLEPVQGEGGVYPAEKAYLEGVRALCDQHGARLIFDEVQTGFGRTGALFACQHYGVEPDLLCLAKSIAGGMPMGAVLARADIQIPMGRHGTTFGGNPLACAAARAVLAVLIQQQLAQRAGVLGDHFCSQLVRAKLSVIREVRHLGLMIGIELRVKVRPLLASLMDRGILALPAGNTVLRLLPPLIIEEGDLDYLLKEVIAVLGAA